MTSKFLSIGECMVEMTPTPDGTYAMGFAGDTLNTAWYARRTFPANWQISYLTAVGKDQVSSQMLDFLTASGIGTEHVRSLNDRTVGLYMIQLSEGERSFAYWRSNSAARCLAADPAHLESALSSADVVYFSGITLAILQNQDRQRFFSAIVRAKSGGARIAFDTNLRPKLWPDLETMRKVTMEAAALADIILPSFEDEERYFGDSDPTVTAQRYRAAGTPLVIVKNGPEDVLCASSAGIETHAVLPAKAIVDTTAAGDSFNSGFFASHFQGGSLADSVLAGSQLASAVIGNRGALIEGLELARA